MPNLKGSEGFIAIFLLVMVLVGAAAGAAIGATLAGSVHLRWLALLAALSSVIVLGVVRGGFGNSFPKLFLAPRGSSIPLGVWIGSIYSAIVGGLAGHDYGQLVGVPSAPIIGLFSGTLAAISMATLMIVYSSSIPKMAWNFEVIKSPFHRWEQLAQADVAGILESALSAITPHLYPAPAPRRCRALLGLYRSPPHAYW